MSLLVDREYLILQLRLAYLRKVDDHVGPRVISVSDIANLPTPRAAPGGGGTATPRQYDGAAQGPSSLYSSGSLGIAGVSSAVGFDAKGSARDDAAPSFHGTASTRFPYSNTSPIAIAGLNDVRYQPELATLHSPKIADERLTDPAYWTSPRQGAGEDAPQQQTRQRQSRTPELQRIGSSGSLGYTTTIYGPGRSGALGMRVAGRRNVSVEARRRGHRKYSDNTSASDHSASALPAKSSRQQMRDNSTPALGEKPVPRRLSDLAGHHKASSEDAGEGHGPFSRPVPTLDKQQTRLNSHEEKGAVWRRASSLRVPPQHGDAAPLLHSSLAKLRSRSSSQPHRPPVSVTPPGRGGIDANSAAPQETDEYVEGARGGIVPPPPPPPRPVRNARRRPSNLSDASVASASDVRKSSGANASESTLFDDESEAQQSRKRSASDGVQPKQASRTLSMPELDTEDRISGKNSESPEPAKVCNDR